MGSSGSSDSETTIRYAPYLETAHQTLIALAQAERATALDQSPYGNYTVTDPDDAWFGTGYAITDFPSQYDMFGSFMAGLDVEDLWNQTHNDSVYGDVVNTVIAADSDIMDDELELDIAKMKAGLSNASAALSTGFKIAEANMRDTKTKAIAKELADLRMRFAEIGQRRWERHLDWNTAVMKIYGGLNQGYFDAHSKYIDQASEMDAKDLLWNFQVLDYEKAIIAAFSGATTSRQKEQKSGLAGFLGAIAGIAQIVSLFV